MVQDIRIESIILQLFLEALWKSEIWRTKIMKALLESIDWSCAWMNAQNWLQMNFFQNLPIAYFWNWQELSKKITVHKNNREL